MITLLDKSFPSKVSVVCGVKNRLPHLEQSLPSWLACPEIDEVVIVDWSSEPPLHGPLFNDLRIRLVRVNEQPHWIASKCHNLGLSFVSSEDAREALGGNVAILRLDADDVLDRGFFAAHPLGSQGFYCLDCRPFDSNKWGKWDNELHLWGVIYARLEHFLAVNGYDERIVTYGWEDTDLILRMLEAGVSPQFLDVSKVHHIPHSNESRLENSPKTRAMLVAKDAFWQADFDYACLRRSVCANKAMTEAEPWSREHLVTEWDLVAVEPTVLTVREHPRRGT